MMFLRHGTFARKSKFERRRKLVVSSFAGLLLTAAVIVCTTVQASGDLNLAYTDALTGGNITGTLTKLDGSAAANVDRDGQVKLNLEFNLDDNELENAKNADAWIYDLSSAVSIYSTNPFVSSVENITSPISIIKDGVTIAEYTVQSNVITVVPQSTNDAMTWWSAHTTNVSIDLSVVLNLDKVEVGVHDRDVFELPGTVGTVTTNSMVYNNYPEARVYATAYDKSSDSFANTFNMTAVQESNGNYYATYNVEFYTNTFFPDLKVSLALSGSHTFNTSEGFVMRTCTTDNCIFDSGATTISIPSYYIAYSADNKTAEINMADFLYGYCEVGNHDCSGAGISGYTLNNSMSGNNANGSDYYIQFETDLGSTNPVGTSEYYGMTATVTSDLAAFEDFIRTVHFSTDEIDPGFIGPVIPITDSSAQIDKRDLTVQNLDSTNKITYSILVNAANYAFLNNGEPYESGETRPMLAVTDWISNNVNISTTAFSATNLDPDNPANNTLSSSDAIICTDENDIIVYDCSFNYDSETRVLTAYVPDGIARKIWYSVTVAYPIPDDTATYFNTAILHANGEEYSSTAICDHTVGSTISNSNNGTMSIKKVNANNLTEAIEGVEFELVQVAYDTTTGELGTETEIDLNGAEDGTYGATNNNGLLQISNLCGYATTSNPSCPNGGQLYYWQEVSAPSPYILANTTKHYFMLYDEGATVDDTQSNGSLAWDIMDLIASNSNNDFMIEMLSPGYEWVVTNLKQAETSIATSIAIANKVTGNTASVDKSFAITIHATDENDEPLVGSFDYDTYSLTDPSGSLSHEGVVNFVNGDATISLNHGSGIVIYGVYIGGSYTITGSNSGGYTVSYICSDLTGTGCSSATSNSGVFVADNGAAADASASGNVAFSDVGQTITLTNDSSTEITGVFNKKPSLVIAIAFGGAFTGLGIFVVRKIRG
ncbi:hypothetical protein IIZ81_00710 [Candidatus Saccharibacteria bacterium]|nr:hypothetical protein [Candidatus Saccharibacteria bacterium]